MKERMSIPLDVPKNMERTYEKNYLLITKGKNRLMLFAGDQRVEHLNDDFYGEGIAAADASPEHLFKIASRARIGAFAAQLGLISRFGKDYSQVPYVVKLNSKSNLVKTTQIDPFSYAWYDVKQVVAFAKRSKLLIPAVGYTIYLGSEYEPQMLREAAQIIYEAHAHGLIVILWIYPRGKSVLHEKDPHLIAGAADIASCLGADFVKVNYPQTIGTDPAQAIKEAVAAAGRTRLICAGGPSTTVEQFLNTLHDQIHVGGTSGNATGRNIHQRGLDEAVRFCNAISAITYDNATVDEALKIFDK